MAIYKLVKNADGSSDCNEIVRRSNSDGTFSFIPFNDENGEFQTYIKWFADGNTPDDSD